MCEYLLPTLGVTFSGYGILVVVRHGCLLHIERKPCVWERKKLHRDLILLFVCSIGLSWVGRFTDWLGSWQEYNEMILHRLAYGFFVVTIFQVLESLWKRWRKRP